MLSDALQSQGNTSALFEKRKNEVRNLEERFGVVALNPSVTKPLQWAESYLKQGEVYALNGLDLDAQRAFALAEQALKRYVYEVYKTVAKTWIIYLGERIEDADPDHPGLEQAYELYYQAQKLFQAGLDWRQLNQRRSIGLYYKAADMILTESVDLRSSVNQSESSGCRWMVIAAIIAAVLFWLT